MNSLARGRNTTAVERSFCTLASPVTALDGFVNPLSQALALDTVAGGWPLTTTKVSE
jgi:hypothetical protein